jgi:RimJ/RimL family protein N-acetyltransferase
MANTRRVLGSLVSGATHALSPSRVTLQGKAVVLEPLQESHTEALYQHIGSAENSWVWDYMFHEPPTDAEQLRSRIATWAKSEDPFFWTIRVMTGQTQGIVGYTSFMHIAPEHRTIEIGNVMYSPSLQRTTAATEAVYLLARYAFRDLGYRRLEWKCNNLNEPSKKAATRYGFVFEGLFRQHYIVKGRNRDTAWFAILDSEWVDGGLEKAFEQWLDASNFDENGQQKKRLEEFRAAESKQT